MIESLIGYKFKKKYLLKDALTHPSYAVSSYQELEFLGDRIIGFVIAELLYHQKKSVKITARKFNNCVNTDALFRVAQKWQLKRFLLHSIQTLSKKNLADTVEAIIAAIYLDSDFKTIYNFIKSLNDTILFKFCNEIDHKMYLQELAQATVLDTPKYTTIGQMENKKYVVQVEVDSLGFAFGEADSIHEASKIAAENLLKKINEKT